MTKFCGERTLKPWLYQKQLVVEKECVEQREKGELPKILGIILKRKFAKAIGLNWVINIAHSTFGISTKKLLLALGYNQFDSKNCFTN